MPWAGPATLTQAPSVPGTAAPGGTERPLTGPSGTGPGEVVTVSATLAANEALARRRERGEPVLPLAFGEAGLPVHPLLTAELASTAGRGAYGPVAGAERLRAAAAGYWTRRSLPTSPDAVIAGPGSKALLFATLLATGTDIAMPRPSWVSYAAQAALIGARPQFVPAVSGQGGCCDPEALDDVVSAARRDGRRIGAVLVTLPDNPTGTLASPDLIRALCAVAERHDLMIVSDEIYRDLVHDPATPVLSPAEIAPDRTVVTTALSKNLAVGGWRLGVARMPEGPAGATLRDRLLGIASEIWSAPTGPVQQAAAVAFEEPAALRQRIADSRALHATVSREAARLCRQAGLTVPAPQAAFYLYPDFEPWRARLAGAFGVRTGSDLSDLLLERYGAGTLPASAFGEDATALRLRLATGLLYGDSDTQREQALTAAEPLRLPWIAGAMTRLAEILADLAA